MWDSHPPGQAPKGGTISVARKRAEGEEEDRASVAIGPLFKLTSHSRRSFRSNLQVSLGVACISGYFTP